MKDIKMTWLEYENFCRSSASAYGNHFNGNLIIELPIKQSQPHHEKGV